MMAVEALERIAKYGDEPERRVAGLAVRGIAAVAASALKACGFENASEVGYPCVACAARPLTKSTCGFGRCGGVTCEQCLAGSAYCPSCRKAG